MYKIATRQFHYTIFNLTQSAKNIACSILLMLLTYVEVPYDKGVTAPPFQENFTAKTAGANQSKKRSIHKTLARHSPNQGNSTAKTSGATT